MRNRFVMATRHAARNLSTAIHYKPVELRNGNLYALCKEDRFDLAFGFSDPAAAWKVIDAIEEEERLT